MNPLGITIGDAAGVGPELILRCAEKIRESHPFVVFGSTDVLSAALDDLRRRGVSLSVDRVVRVETPREAVHVDARTLPVIEVAGAPEPLPAAYPWGEAVAWFGRLQYEALVTATRAAMAGETCAVVTAPWHKARLLDVGLPAGGHTEVLAELTGTDDPVMLLAGDRLRVALATIHVPISEVPARLSIESIARNGQTLADGLRQRYGIDRPRIAICGLNPHAGESGTIGDEDETVVAPAVKAMQAAGIDALGPMPADTLFPLIVAGRMHADAVLAMYHDQGLVALKTVHFGESANVTLGLPIVRTSVDHGTAYDIAGSGLADAGSFIYAAALAAKMATRASQA